MERGVQAADSRGSRQAGRCVSPGGKGCHSCVMGGEQPGHEEALQGA